jgi:hypothetical protein
VHTKTDDVKRPDAATTHREPSYRIRQPRPTRGDFAAATAVPTGYRAGRCALDNIASQITNGAAAWM